MGVPVIVFLSEYVIFCLIWSNFGGNCQDFGYGESDGPARWGDKYSQCVGKFQSPIDIETATVTTKSFPPLKFTSFDETLDEVVLRNNGHTVVMTITGNRLPILQGGPLDTIYKFKQIHFHWGPNDTVGSENHINHHSFPLELHLVMYNTAYKQYKRAMNFRDGLTVLAFLISVSPRDNVKYNIFESALHEVRDLFSNKTVHKIASLNDLTTLKRDKYFTYKGSLTTPPCSEVVTWIEFVDTVPLSREQINAFRMLSTKDGQIAHNFRPVQPINDRIIYYNTAVTESRGNVLCIVIALSVAVYWSNH